MPRNRPNASQTSRSGGHGVRAHSWCFTINNYTQEEETALASLQCTYLVYGREVAPTTGTPHLQGYCRFATSMPRATLSRHLPRANLQQARGTPQQNRAYCVKDGDFTERGSLPAPRGRGDLMAAIAAVRETSSIKSVVSGGFNLQSIKVAELWLRYNETPRNWSTPVFWLYGPTASGKSLACKEVAQRAGVELYWKRVGGKWFDDYDGHCWAILDEFRPSWWPFSTMLQLLDEHPCRVENKGGSRQWKPRLIFITSPIEPHAAYGHIMPTFRQQLTRRITFSVKFPDESASFYEFFRLEYYRFFM